MKAIGKKQKRILSVMLAAIMIVSICIGGWYFRASADNDYSIEPPSVKIKSADIEPATLVVGSHLIYVGSMTDELYEIAQKSATTFSQNNIYYKSELGGNAWYEISSATSIADISTSGEPVQDSVIEAISFTHHTKSDGITYDLVNKTAVNIFNITDPYKLEEMEELRPILMQYQQLLNKEKLSEVEEYNKKILREFFAEDIHKIKISEEVIDETDIAGDVNIKWEIYYLGDETVEEFEAAMASLQNFSNALNGMEDEADQKEIITMVMGKLDASRRSYLMAKVYVLLEDLAADAQESPSEDGNTALITAIIEAQSNAQSSMNEYSAKGLTYGVSVIGQEEYELCDELIQLKNGSTLQYANLVSRLADLYNIRDGIIEKGEQELEYLDETLVPAAAHEFEKALEQGPSEEYQTARATGASKEVLNGYLQDIKSSINTTRIEYQFLIEAKTKRMGTMEAQEYVAELIDGIETLRSYVPAGATSTVANETVDQHEQWLRELLTELVNSGEGGTEMSELLEEKEELLTERQNAYDSGDLAEGKRLDALIEAKDQDITNLENEYSEILTSEEASEAEKALAAANMGDGTAGKVALDIANQAVSDIQSGNFDGLENSINAIGALTNSNSKATAGALNSIKEALEASSTFEDSYQGEGGADGLMKDLDSLLDAAEERNRSNGLTATEIESAIEEMLGGSFSSLSEEDQLKAVLAIEWYGEIKNSLRIKELAATYADMMANNNSPYAFPKLKTATEEFVSLKALSESQGYRYVFDDSRMVVTLQKRDVFYEFTVNSSKVRTTKGTTDALSAVAQYQTYVYIPEVYLQENFKCQVEYMDETGIAILYDEAQQTSAEEIYNALLTKGGD